MNLSFDWSNTNSHIKKDLRRLGGIANFLLQLSPLKEDLYVKIQGNTHIENLVFMNLFSLVDKSFLGTKEMIS